MFQRSIEITESPGEALRRCARALALAGFKNVQVSEAAMMATGEKRPFAQWTRGQVTITVEPAAGGSEVTISGRATAQSLISLFLPPDARLVNRVVEALSQGR